MSFSTQEEPHPTPVNMSLKDIFKQENGMSHATYGVLALPQKRTNTPDSVDMLLKEINSGSLDPSTSFTDSLLAIASPIKPLNFPSHKSENTEIRRDYNSSSDTYVSDHGDQDDYNLETSMSREDATHQSPSKSIMKSQTGNNGSPKKQVAFHNDEELEEFHLYTAHEDTENQLLPMDSDPIAHAWSNVDQLDLHDDVDSSSPPVPPPHSSDTITGLLGDQRDDNDDINVSDLSHYRLSHKSFSNLSLNEKLGIFLNNPQFQTAQDDMDQHLDRLDHAREQETNVNIHHLSFQLETARPVVQNPLNALTRTEEVMLKSGGSSQSSLQSLMDSNRYLDVNSVGNQSSGIVFNDGIKGFLDNVAGLIIPATDDHRDDSSDIITFGKPSRPRKSTNESFNQSYNLTEKSIPNLLNSSSQLDLSGKDIDRQEEHSLNQEEAIDYPTVVKKEAEEHFLLPEPNSSPEAVLPMVKSESSNSIVKLEHEQSFIKPEPDQSLVKQEPRETEVKEEPQEYIGESPVAEEDAEPSPYLNVKSEANHSIEIANPEQLAEISIQQEETVEKVTDRTDTERDGLKTEPVEHVKEHIPPSIESDKNHLLVSFPASVSKDNESVDFEIHDISLHMEETEIVEVAYRDNRNVKLISPIDMSESSLDEEENKTNNSEALDSSIEQVKKLKTVYSKVQQDEEGLTVDTSSEVFEDTSEDFLGKIGGTLKLDEKDNSLARDHEEENSILANSSNIVPHPDIDLPSPYTQSLEFGYNSFEESLSAENDADTKKNDFISIWHSQQQQRKTYLKPSELSYRVSSILNYDANLAPQEKPRIPSLLNQRKFKEVNLVSKRIVSPGFEDLHVSGFLPEISQDSGLEGHFHSLLGTNNNKSYTEERTRRKSWSSQNILSDLTDNNVPEPASIIPKRHSINITLKPKKVTVVNEPVHAPNKKSKFYVPPFEIRRTDSILSPKNKYNDIFDDHSFTKPTIKANGMKTLPSMDRDDVKRIMQMKQAMSQEEYSHLKHIGNKKSTVVQEHATQANHIPQVASIHCDSLMSHLSTKRPMQHVADELCTKPVAIASKDQLIEETKVSPPTSVLPRVADHVKTEGFPEPDPELISDQSHGNSTPTAVTFGSRNPFLVNQPKSLQPPVTPTTETPSTPPPKASPSTPRKNSGPGSRKSPIKIHSPVKIIKSGNSVTGVVLDSKRDQEFTGDELLNQKPRESKTPGYALSTISVPSKVISKENTFDMNDNPSIANAIHDSHAASSSTSRNTSVVSSERGKLFFRVVGFKNINLPGIKDRNGSFSIILDNGVHCIKTPSYRLDGPNVMIGKEFELTVGESLAFILTMKATYDKPKGTLVEVSERKVVKPKNKLRRMFGSKDIVTVTKYVPTSVKDEWKNTFATDGSFARCYVDLEQYEGQVLGKCCSFNITCFNEWGTTPQGDDSIKRKPYVIGQLEVKMLYVPRSEPYEILPSSIKYAYERLDDLKDEKRVSLSGYMHQEGGDCETWKKRWFVLKGTSLVAHSEFSHKTRANINLAKVAEVIYVDKDDAQRSSSNYRNFSDILLMENAFKIRFANGEVIDFGAANKTEKVQWIKAIQEIVYRNKFRQQPWVKLMQRRNGHVLLLA